MGYLYIIVPLCRVPTGMISKKNDSFLRRVFCHILTDEAGAESINHDDYLREITPEEWKSYWNKKGRQKKK